MLDNPQQQPTPTGQPIPQPINTQQSGLRVPKKHPKRKLLWWIIGVIAIIVIASLGGGILWYNTQLAPVGTDLGQLKQIEVVSGSTPSQIGKQLEQEGVIRSSTAFDIYTRLSGTRDTLKAGTYRLSPAETTPQIVEHLVNGAVDEFSITFLPGATLAENRKVLLEAGYSEAEVDAAFSSTYSTPLLADRPANADLEGYIYGETYNFNVGATAKDILQRTFDEFYSQITENKLLDGFKKQGLNLHQAITLASIVQREVHQESDQKQVAQVFYSRLAIDMELGSDVTYQYIADKMGVPRDVNLDSPYNTRRYPGLPPGPIATPGLGALQAVAQPASGDYLYFLSGDDDKTYFARTYEQHEANIVNHCQIKCSTL